MSTNIKYPSEARLLTERLRESVAPEEKVVREQVLSERNGNLQMVLEGTVVRQRLLADGRSQIVAIYQRDDVVNLSTFLDRPPAADTLIALRGTVMASVPAPVVEHLRQLSLTAEDGMVALVLRELKISEERIMSLGKRSAVEAMAHFFCETLFRSGRGYSTDASGRCAMPVTQEMLASILGYSSVHTNRTLQLLRATKLVSLLHFELEVSDVERLADLGRFDNAYLTPV